MKGSYAVGIYDGAYRFFGIIIVVISNFVLSLFPVISEYFKTDRMAFETVCKKAIKYFFLLVFPGVVILFFISGPLILLVFKEKYMASITILKVLSLAIIPYGITEIFAHMLIASHNLNPTTQKASKKVLMNKHLGHRCHQEDGCVWFCLLEVITSVVSILI